jgi:hypothetical protein
MKPPSPSPLAMLKGFRPAAHHHLSLRCEMMKSLPHAGFILPQAGSYL